MNINQLYQTVQLDKHFTYFVNFNDFTANTQGQSAKIQIGAEDFHCTDIFFSVIDNTGKVFSDMIPVTSLKKDLIYFSFQDNDSPANVFQSSNYDIYSVNGMKDDSTFKGYTFKAQREYTFSLQMAAIPATKIFDTTLKVQLILAGYKLPAFNSLYNIESVFKRIDSSRYFSMPVKFKTITTNTDTDTQPLKVTGDDFLVTDFDVMVMDAAGSLYSDPMWPYSGLRDLIYFSMETANGGNYQSTGQGYDIYALQRRKFDKMFKGLLLPKNIDYNFYIKMQDLPDTKVFTTSLNVQINLKGYRLLPGA